jgi:hypothetical protein
LFNLWFPAAWIFLIASSWCSLIYHSVPCVSFKLVVRCRSLIRFRLDFLFKATL